MVPGTPEYPTCGIPAALLNAPVSFRLKSGLFGVAG